MIDKKELISTYLQQFGSHYQISRLLNPTLRIDDEFISHFFEQVVDQYGETFAITEEEKTEIERKIKSQYCIFQDEGAALVGDYEHDFMWYANLQAQEDYDEYYWPRYKAHLENKNFSPAGIDTLENKTLPKLMSYIGNPNEDSPFSIRGLVVGDVQSGKTSNYLGLITKAADAGYKVIFLLTGTIESLRRQTQKRVEEGFIGYDSVNAEDVGVGRGSRTPKAFTSRNNDFTGKNDQNTTYKINDNASEPMIFVIKKNVSVLKKLYASLKNINTSSAVSQITVPMIMIDDEADNASINTNKKDEDPTKINNYIRKILTLFARNTYVGFTATPFANVFISYDTQDEMLADDLFPRHFIYSLESPSNYCGAQKYFFESNSNVRFINDYDDKVFPLRHKKEWDGDKLFPSFYHSINVFLLANAIRDIREVEKNTHRSMLINMSRFTDVQFVIKEIVENYFADMKRAIKQNCRCKKEDYMRNSLISALYESYELEYADNNWFGKTATWDQVFERLPEAIKDIEIAVVNSSRNSNKLDYSKHERDGLRVIAIGGLALSRGLTLEGLCVSYFYRNTATFDVLMQMGRWFGYRDDYGDMCKIYLTDFSYRYYREISQSIDQLKKDIRTMGAQGKRPEDYGIRVRNNSSEMGITAANKMRNTKAKIDRKSFYGSVFETPYLHRSLSAVSENIDHTSAFLRELTVAQKDDSVQHPYIRDISARRVFELLQVLNIHEANENFDTKQLCRFIAKHLEMKFDVLVMGGAAENTPIEGFEPVFTDTCVKRRFDIVNRDEYLDQQIIRINGIRAHLWGPRDTANGLSEADRKRVESQTSVKAQDYMLEGRNALLIIYFIQPSNEGVDIDDYFTAENTMEEEVKSQVKLLLEMRQKNMKYLVGYGIGFPHKQGLSGDSTNYIVNKTCNYYTKQHEEDYQTYGEI